MEQAAVKRGCIKKGNNIDYEKISNIILDDFRSGRLGRISLESRLKAKICEVCGCTENDRYEIHHVNKVKNLKGKSE